MTVTLTVTTESDMTMLVKLHDKDTDNKTNIDSDDGVTILLTMRQ